MTKMTSVVFMTAAALLSSGTSFAAGAKAVANLESRSGESVMDLLQELNLGGATICLVTHDPRYARHAQRSIHLFDGRTVDGPVDEVMDLAAINEPGRRQNLAGQTNCGAR